jgi:hypothetical protein
MSKYVVQAGWEHAPHLDERAKAELLAAIPPSQREARMNGTPSIGAGLIYPVPDEQIVVPDFAIPKHYKRAYAMDVGWRRTAALWGALDEDSDVLYCYSEHYASEGIPSLHADSIKARGKWIKGVIDPAANGRNPIDGQALVDLYARLELDLDNADNAVSAGLYEVWQRMVGGRLKLFASLANLRAELRLYRREAKGKVVKANDHLCDCLRYLVMNGLDRAGVEPVEALPQRRRGGGWAG